MSRENYKMITKIPNFKFENLFNSLSLIKNHFKNLI